MQPLIMATEESSEINLEEALKLALGPSPVINFKILYKLLRAIISNDIFKNVRVNVEPAERSETNKDVFAMQRGPEKQIPIKTNEDPKSMDGMGMAIQNTNDIVFAETNGASKTADNDVTQTETTKNEKYLKETTIDSTAGNGAINSEVTEIPFVENTQLLDQSENANQNMHEAVVSKANNVTAIETAEEGATDSKTTEITSIDNPKPTNESGNVSKDTEAADVSDVTELIEENDDAKHFPEETTNHGSYKPYSDSDASALQAEKSNEIKQISSYVIDEIVRNSMSEARLIGDSALDTSSLPHVRKEIEMNLRNEMKSEMALLLSKLSKEISINQQELQNHIKASEHHQQIYDNRFEAIIEKVKISENCMELLTNLFNPNTSERIETAVSELHEEVCDPRKKVACYDITMADLKKSVDDNYNNCTMFFSKVNRMEDAMTDLWAKLSYVVSKFETQTRWNHAIKNQLVELEETKANLQEMEKALMNKGDLVELNLKASIVSVNCMMEEMTSRLLNFDELNAQRLSKIEKELIKNSNEISNRLDISNAEIHAIIAHIKTVIKEIQKHMSCEAFASTSTHLRGLACLTCQSDACIRSKLCHPVIPKLKPLSIYTKKTCNSDIHPSNGDSSIFMNRFSGGKHTVTDFQSKVIQKGSENFNRYLRKGTTGEIYLLDLDESK